MDKNNINKPVEILAAKMIEKHGDRLPLVLGHRFWAAIPQELSVKTDQDALEVAFAKGVEALKIFVYDKERTLGTRIHAVEALGDILTDAVSSDIVRQAKIVLESLMKNSTIPMEIQQAAQAQVRIAGPTSTTNPLQSAITMTITVMGQVQKVISLVDVHLRTTSADLLTKKQISGRRWQTHRVASAPFGLLIKHPSRRQGQVQGVLGRGIQSAVPPLIRYYSDMIQVSLYNQDGDAMAEADLSGRKFLRLEVQTLETKLDGKEIELSVEIPGSSFQIQARVPLRKGERGIIVGEAMIEVEKPIIPEYIIEADRKTEQE